MTDNPTNYRRDTAPTAPTTPSLDDLAQRIKTEHQDIIRAKRNIVERAMKIGDWLKEAKATLGHGNFTTWRERNCELSARTATNYMRLADNRAKLEENLKSAKNADLTLTLDEAMRIAEEVIDINSTGDAGASGSTGGESKTTGTGNSSTVTGSGSTKTKSGGRKASNTSDTVDDVTERLIELLKKLETETAIAAVAVIVRRFGDANWLPAAERKKAAA
jgi:hypothetical protein